MNMEFLDKNCLNTTTMLTLNSATGTAGFLFDRRRDRQYVTSLFNNDLTTSTIVVSFAATQTVDRIALENVNWKEFRMFYNGATANTFTWTTTCGTVTSSWASNSLTNLYLICSDTPCTSVSFEITKTQTANEEKKVGQIWITNQLYQFPRNPQKSGYRPTAKPKEIEHVMSDGGTAVFRVRDKYHWQLSLSHREDVATLRTIYELDQELVFVPFPTGTSWDGDIFEVVWTDGFDRGMSPSMNHLGGGRDVRIMLKETPA